MWEREECEARSAATAEIPLDLTAAVGQWFHHSNME